MGEVSEMDSKCAKCGSVLASDDPDGQCPSCLFAIGLSDIDELDDVRAPAPAAGKWPARFGDYELLQEISRGGMGIVYRARQISVNRPVALKMILNEALASDSIVQRFHLEAEAAANLSHPNIVPIYEIGEREGRHFFTMKLIEGASLGRRMAEFSVSSDPAKSQETLRVAASLVARLARAVSHAHERGVIHRDLKPANVLIDKDGQPHITDFGLAKLSDQNIELTLSGVIMGTPAYMAPEQAAGKAGAATTAADTYSLGAILYHLLTGRPPFAAATILETVRLVSDANPVAPERLNHSVDRSLSSICLKCLEKNPANRYGSAHSLAEDLEAWLNGETVTARPASQAETFWRWCRRKPAVAGAIGATLASLIAVAVVSTTAAFKINLASKAAVAAQGQATEKLWQSYLAQARALRWSGRPGRRFEALKAIREAVSIRSSLDLRNEAIAALTLTDIQPMPGGKSTSRPTEHICIDPPHNQFLFLSSNGEATVRQLSDDALKVRIPAGGGGDRYFHGFSPDGRWLSLQRTDREMRLWDLQSIRTNRDPAMARPAAEFNGIADAMFSPDGTRLAMAYSDGRVSVAPMNDVQQEKVVAPALQSSRLFWDSKSERLACYYESNVTVINARTGAVAAHWHLSDEIASLAWSPDGNFVASACADQLVHILDMKSGMELAPLAGHNNAVTSVAFSADGSVLVSGSWDGQLRFWDFASRRQILHTAGGDNDIVFFGDGRQFAVYADSCERVDVFEIAMNESSIDLKSLSDPSDTGSPDALMFDPNGNWVATGLNGRLTFWNPHTGREISQMNHLMLGTLLLVNGKQDLLAWNDAGFWRLPITSTNASQEPVPVTSAEPQPFNMVVPEAWQSLCPPDSFRNFKRGANPIRSAASADGRTFAFGLKSRACVFNAKTGVLQSVTGLQKYMKYVALSPDGKWLATGGWHEYNVKVWNALNGELVKELPTEMSPNVAFSPDGQWLVTSTGAYQFWRNGDWKLDHQIERADFEQLPGPMAFSADGKILALAYTRGTVRLVAPDTGATLAQLEPDPDNELIALAFNSDASQLAMTRANRPPEIWNIAYLRRQLAELKLDW